MKKYLALIVCSALILGVLLQTTILAGDDPEILSQPYDLTVKQSKGDDDNPFGGVEMLYKIDYVPYEYENEDYHVQIDVEQRIGENGTWESIGGPLAEELVEGFYMESPGLFKYSITWAEDYSGVLVSYRVRMIIDDTDAFSEPIASTPWSNVAVVGIKSSSWATPEIEKALKYGIVPNSIIGDFTTPITREEFAELAVLLYEVYTGNEAEPAPEDTFMDCKNPQVLKAYKLGIVNGIGNGKFDPKALTNREQIAAMLNRAVKAIAPDADFSTVGAPTFSDEKDVSSWFVENVKFMSKNNFIKGSNGIFDPKGTCTREMSVLIAVRVYEFYN